MRRLLFAALLALAPLGTAALSPDEALSNPDAEARARALFAELRCPVCQSEPIDSSNAAIARDLRLLVRERIVAGDDDDEVLAYVADRYGEFVLFRPPMTVANAPLWLAAPVFIVFGAALVAAVLRRRSREARRPPVALSPEEQARLDRLIRD